VARIRFTDNVQRHVACPDATVPGTTLREVLDAYFTQNAQARGYVLDEQNVLRQHMVIFLNGQPIRDRRELSDTVTDDAVIDVMQALSGG
jgi:sulfur-carrier protein